MKIQSRILLAATAAVCVSLLYLEGVLNAYLYMLLIVLVFIAGAAHIFFSKNSDTIIGRLLLVVIATALTFAVADLALRPFVQYGRPHWKGMPGNSAKLLPVAPEYFGETNPAGLVSKQLEFGDMAISWRMEKFRDFRHVEARYDRHGYRNEEPRGAPPVYDAIVLGDSFGYGRGTTQEKIWARLLDTRYGIKTYNLSKNGGNPWDEFLTLDSEIGRLKTRSGAVVIWALYAGNDLEDLRMYDDIPTDITRAGSMPLHRFRAYSPIRLLGDRAVEMLFTNSMEREQHKLSGRRGVGEVNPVDPGTIIPKPFPNGKTMLFFEPYMRITKYSYQLVAGSSHFAKLEATMALMKQFADNNKLTVKIVLIPSKEEVYRWVADGSTPWTSPKSPGGFSRALARAARRDKFEFIDLKPFMIDASKKEYEATGRSLWWYDDSHINEQGHAVMAKLVYEKLLKLNYFGTDKND
jgi:hypothetical protein